jgi:hypothetical protein
MQHRERCDTDFRFEFLSILSSHTHCDTLLCDSQGWLGNTIVRVPKKLEDFFEYRVFGFRVKRKNN